MSLSILCEVIQNHPSKIWLISYLTDATYAEFRDDKKYVKGRLLDIGCGDKPYKKFWSSVVSDHVGVDHELSFHGKSKVDCTASAYSIPLADDSFDSVICNAVLEHLEEPEAALRECKRILRQGGIAIYSVPFIWHVHEEPRDFYRFSGFGLRYLFEKCGFEVLELRALSGFWVTFGQLFVYNLYRFNRGPLRWFRIIEIMGIVIQLISFVLDRLDKTEQWTWMNVVVARKPNL
jgi:SAM-dependent methyltransferase